MSKVKSLPIKTEPKIDKHKDFIDNKVYNYIREDKATLQQKQNKYIVIYGEKYYLVDDVEDKAQDIFF